jgi:SPOR domain
MTPRLNIDRVTKSLTGDQQESFKETVERAKDLAAATGSWTIVIGTDKTLEAAQFEVRKAEKQGYNAVVYKKAAGFVTTVGSYPNEQSANVELVSARAKTRADAFVVNLGRWCPASEQEQEADYTKCLQE